MVAFIASPVMLILGLIGRREWFYPFCEWGAQAWLKLSGVRVVTKGTENLKPNESYIFISNHRSYLDTAAMFAFTARRMGLPAKKELLKIPIFGYGMQWVNILPIDRSNPKRAYETMDVIRQKLNQGISFAIFGEGTRALPGELLPFKRGAFRVAIETGKPIIPVAIKNSDVLMGKKTGVAAPGTITVVFLPQVETNDAKGEKDLEALRDKVRAMIAAELDKD